MSSLRFAGWDLLFIHVPGWLILVIGGLAVLFLIWYFFFHSARRSATIRFSDLGLVRSSKTTWRIRIRPLLPILKISALACLFLALARPQAGTEQRDVQTEGIDIMMTLDISSSMMAEDFEPNNRLYVAKEEIAKFIDHRTNDRIGLVVFAQDAATQCPLTLDYNVLKNLLKEVDFGMLNDGTAIGLALATSVNRLKKSKAKSKVIILLTDGVNNAGEIDPMTAANIAKTLGIKVYTIGAGKPGNARYPVNNPLFGRQYRYIPVEIDEASLKQIAELTGGKYFRARSKEELSQIYDEIDHMEKTEIKVNQYTQYEELFFPWLLTGFGFLVLELIISRTWLRKIP